MIQSSYKTLWPYLYQHRVRLVIGLASLILVDLLQLLIPIVIKNAVDHLSSMTADAWSLAVAGLSIAGMAAAIGVFRYVWRRLILGFSREVERDLRDRLYGKLLVMPPSWYMKRTSGEVMALATNDLDAIRMAAGFGLVALVDSVLLGSAAIGFMIWIDFRLTLLALIPMPVIPILTRIMGGKMHRRYRRVQDVFARMSGEVREYLAGIRVVKAYARERLVMEDMDRVGREYVSENIRLNKISGSFFPMMLVFTNLSVAIVIYFGGRMTIFNSISPGDFVAFISYLGLLTWPMMALGWVTNLVQRGAASLDRINMVLDDEPEIQDPPNPKRLDRFEGRVDVKNLTFHYPGRTETIFNGLNISFPVGQTTALVGRTGAGKSTLLNMIPRLLSPPLETVFLDGIEIESLSLKDLRQGIGYVPQDGYIFSGTVAENIAFGVPDASDERIRAAARTAELEKDILSFPDEYETDIGERGVTLSGGQKQRLALARALLLDPPLLILDDTLSSVDAAVEERILSSLAKVRKGKTTIISSHRLSSLREANLIHVLEDGRVSQSGLHEDLLLQDGYYARLHLLQMAQADGGVPLGKE